MIVEVMAQVMAEKPSSSLVLVSNKVGACGVRSLSFAFPHSAILTPYNLAPHRWQEAQKSLPA